MGVSVILALVDDNIHKELNESDCYIAWLLSVGVRFPDGSVCS